MSEQDEKFKYLNVSGMYFRIKCGAECHKEKYIAKFKRRCSDCPYGHMEGTCDVLFAKDVDTLMEYLKYKNIHVEDEI